jgi:hypothetical protein
VFGGASALLVNPICIDVTLGVEIGEEWTRPVNAVGNSLGSEVNTDWLAGRLQWRNVHSNTRIHVDRRSGKE